MKYPLPLDLEWDELVDLRWFCRDCGQFRVHPYRVVGDGRFHSYHCKTPMIRVLVTIRQVDPKSKASDIDKLMGIESAN